MKSLTKKIVHPVLKLMIRTTASIYFERVDVKGLHNISKEGPAILACNHPNSFLDALIITVFYRRPIFYIARGDAFKKPFGAKVLSFLNNVPIFRKEEGINNMSKNEETFTHCMEILKEGDTVLLFSEGLCENEWYFRPLRKGTARLVHDAWNHPEIGDKLKVIPVSTNYSGWCGLGHSTYVELLEPIEKASFQNIGEQGLFLRAFNERLAESLSKKIASIDKTSDIEAQNIVTGFMHKNLEDGDEKGRKALQLFRDPNETEFHKRYLDLANYLKSENVKYYNEHGSHIVNFLVSAFILPIAIILNIIPYSICKYIAEKTTRRNVFYDSVFFGSLLVLGPVYMLFMGLFAVKLTHTWYGMMLPLIALLSAWSFEASRRNFYCFLQRKKLEKVSVMLAGLFGRDNG